MKHLFLLILLPFLFACSSEQKNSSVYAEEKSTPFEAVQWKGDKALYLIEDQWYELIAFQGKSGPELVEICKLVYPQRWKERFGEDFVEFIVSIGLKPKAVDVFTLRTVEGDTIQKELSFEESKRNAVQDYFQEHHFREDYAEVNFEEEITQEAMKEDLEHLRTSIHRAFSYADRLGVDTDAEIDRMKAALPANLRVQDFAIRIQELILKYGDGHSKVDLLDFTRYGILPFKTAAFQDKIIAFEEGELLEAGFPYLAAVNGIAVGELLKLPPTFKLPHLGEHTQKVWGAGNLRYMGYILQKEDRFTKEVKVKLTNDAGEERMITKPLLFPETEEEKSKIARLLEFTTYNSFSHKMLADEIGYIKIADMLTNEPDEIVMEIMEEFKQSKGIVIDVRGNTGGGRATTLALLPYFLSETQSPLIGNLAKRRMNVKAEVKEGVIRKRYLHPISSSRFDAIDKERIKTFLQDFEEKWAYDESKYSDWHFFLLKRDANKAYYPHPVVILQDEYCFSATDIFLASFDQLDNVKLMGTTSGGGSGKAEEHILPNSHITVRLSSIISFQPNGKLFEGEGVAPDIYLEPKQYTDIVGNTDSQLDAAIDYIKSHR
ncbi:MAG: S41 family peptidase [Bacteroidota bacterium]